MDSLLASYSKAENDTDRINKYAEIGTYLINGGKYRESLSYYEKIINVFSKSYPKKCIDAKNKIAFIYISLEAYDKADSVIKEMLTESAQLNYSKGTGLAYRNMGLINTYKGNYKEAVVYHLKALKIWEEIKNMEKTSISNSDLGIVFYYQTNYEKAIYYWENANKSNPNKNSGDYFNNYANMGQAYIGLGNYDKASECLTEVRNYYAKNKKSTSYTNALTGLANIEFKRKNYQKALNYYTEIIKLREEYNARNNDLAITYLNVCLVYQEMGKPKEALEFGLKGYQKALESEDNCFMRIITFLPFIKKQVIMKKHLNFLSYMLI
jgi:tetratricopeptide (TPR) repeat protein